MDGNGSLLPDQQGAENRACRDTCRACMGVQRVATPCWQMLAKLEIDSSTSNVVWSLILFS